jgi:hypothetical protein
MSLALGIFDGNVCKGSVVMAIGVPRASNVAVGESHAESKRLDEIAVDGMAQ